MDERGAKTPRPRHLGANASPDAMLLLDFDTCLTPVWKAMTGSRGRTRRRTTAT